MMHVQSQRLTVLLWICGRTVHAHLRVGLPPLLGPARAALRLGRAAREVHLRHVLVVVQQRLQLLACAHPCRSKTKTMENFQNEKLLTLFPFFLIKKKENSNI